MTDTADITSHRRPPLITLQHLSREFSLGSSQVGVLHDINLTLYQGEMIAIVGPSGSGKSTLMHILGCLDAASSGSYEFSGQLVSQMDSSELAQLRRERFGFIFQRYHLLSKLTALENVCLPAIYAGTARPKRQQRAAELLAQLGLGDKLNSYPNQLSGGQQQRVSIARALMNGGEVIFADEPTGALDSRSGAEVMAILHQLKDAGHTVIMVTHDPALAQQATRIIELKDGCIIADRYTNHATDAQPSPQIPATFSPASASLGNFFIHGKESLSMALVAMTAHKLRTLLTMLGIIIGIASVVSIVGIGQGSQQKILAGISQLGKNTIYVFNGYPYGDSKNAFAGDNLTIADSQAVAKEPYALNVSPQVNTTANGRYQNTQTKIHVDGVGFGYLEATGESLAMGQSLTPDSISSSAQEVILDHNAYQTFFKQQENPLGKTLFIDSVPATVVGVLAKSKNSFADSNPTPGVYLPYTAVMHRMLGTHSIDGFVVLLDNSTPSASAEKAIIQLLKSRHGTEDFYLISSDSLRQTIADTTNSLTLLIASIAIISLLVGGIGVMNIMLVAVTERTREIGIRMAVGARQSDILQQFLLEAMLVCLLGGMIGVGISFAIGGLINSLGGEFFAFVYSPKSVAIAFIYATATGVIFGFWPAKNAAKLSPISALGHD